MFVTNISNSSQSITKFFSCLQASEVINKFFAIKDCRTLGSNAELRNKQYYRVVCTDVIRVLHFRLLQSKLRSYASAQFSKFWVSNESL